jgi:thiol-disulfide isomerase/thioredoxin
LLPDPDGGEDKEELKGLDFGYYSTVKDKLMMMSTTKEGLEALLKRQIAGKTAAKPLPVKLAPGEYMKANFNVKPYFEMMMDMIMMFGGKGKNPILKELAALEIAPWPINVSDKKNTVNVSIDMSYASIKTLADFSEKAMKASVGAEASPTAGLDIEESEIDYSKIQIPMDLPVALSNGGTTTLAQLSKGKKAVLLDFWASWCGPCMALMPELKKKAAALAPQGIVVAGMNTEAEPATAERSRKKLEIQFPWLVEPEDAPFSELLEIDSIPRMILISSEGKVLYNGHPQDPRLHAALAELGVEL